MESCLKVVESVDCGLFFRYNSCIRWKCFFRRKTVKEVSQVAKKGRLVFRTDRCKGCELCVNACPMKILKLDDEAVNIKGYHPISVTDPDKCIACASCAMMCPDGIINVYVEE